jgi:hypothetical protein
MSLWEESVDYIVVFMVALLISVTSFFNGLGIINTNPLAAVLFWDNSCESEVVFSGH